MRSMSVNSSVVDETVVESWFISTDIVISSFVVLFIVIDTICLLTLVVDKRCHTVPMLLLGNTFLTSIVFQSVLLSLLVFTIENDRHRRRWQDALCVFRGYLIIASSTLVFYSFVLQAIYRYIYVRFPTYLLWRTIRFQLVLIGLTWLLAFLFCTALIATGDIVYDADNQICQLPFRLSFAMLYTAFFLNVLPMLLIVVLYMKLLQHVKEMSKRVGSAHRLSRARRELKMVKRTVLLVMTLAASSLPYLAFIVMSFFGRAPKYHVRFALVGLDASCLVGTLILLHSNDPLKAALMRRIRKRTNVVDTVRVA